MNHYSFKGKYQLTADITITITNSIITIPIEATGITTIIPIPADMGDTIYCPYIPIKHITIIQADR